MLNPKWLQFIEIVWYKMDKSNYYTILWLHFLYFRTPLSIFLFNFTFYIFYIFYGYNSIKASLSISPVVGHGAVFNGPQSTNQNDSNTRLE